MKTQPTEGFALRCVRTGVGIPSRDGTQRPGSEHAGWTEGRKPPAEPLGEETQGTLQLFCFHFELDFSAVFLIASDSSSVYVLLGCMTSEVCVPGRRELQIQTGQSPVDQEVARQGIPG